MQFDNHHSNVTFLLSWYVELDKIAIKKSGVNSYFQVSNEKIIK